MDYPLSAATADRTPVMEHMLVRARAFAEPLIADETRSTQIMARIPAARWGNPGDMVGAAIFLASSASDYVHGSTVVVDGGWMGR